MATGRSNKLVAQTGEYLVAAELCRRGLIATTFTGNVPHYDIIASNEEGKHVLIQVKTSRGSSWQLGKITSFCDISFDKEQRQKVGSLKRCPVRDLVVVFVLVDAKDADCYYVLTWRKLRDVIAKEYADFLEKNHGKRPKKPDSLYSAIFKETLKPYKDKWTVIETSLK